MKTYKIEKNISDWVSENKTNIYYDILEECEKEADSDKTSVTIAMIKSLYGVTYFSLPTPEKVQESLNKCIAHFVEPEEYELAARARDCGLTWMNKEYIKKNQQNGLG